MPALGRCAVRGAWLPALLLVIASMPAFAQRDTEASTPDTGDAWIDVQLVDIGRYANRHPDAFADELVRYQGAPRPLVEEALRSDVVAGDLYYACALAQAFGRPCREVLDAWRADPGEGWSGAASRLDSERAGAARDRVKRGIVASYDRWARPIALDAQLRRALPDRAAPAR